MPETASQPIDVNVLIAVAVLTFAAPLGFLGLVVVAAVQRRRSGRVGSRLAAVLAATGGVALGSLVLVEADLVVELPIYVVIGASTFALWRRRRRAQAGWLMAGAALPWSLLWGYYVALLLGGAPFDEVTTPLRFAVGAVPLVVGLVVALRGDPALRAPAVDAPPGQPGSRSFGNIAEAIRDAARIGPFGQPEIAMLVVMVATLLVVPFLLPRDLPDELRFLIVLVVTAGVGTETYVRSWPALSRRAFEAFSWLGEWELAHVREVTGRGVPATKAGARVWLGRRPERTEELATRIELLLFVGQVDEARALLPKLPAETPWEQFGVAALRDLVEWQAGGEGDLPGLEAAAARVLPADGDERLRAEVSVATAKVRRLMATGTVTGAEAVAPLVDVRPRLGTRADGQIGRALRRRLFPVLLGVSLLVGVAMELSGGGIGLLA